ncbi:glycosyltransferase family 39 protein [Candidatus Microgenomates bacterium]|nr:glycosyltransferase family 39 protein [Candidatus Microgenomates bacterium]
MKSWIRDFLTILGAAIIPPFLIWLPFFFRIESFWGIKLPQNGMATIISNFDGPYYIVAAKSLYNPVEIEKFQFPLPNEYYAAHFPGFPLLIKAFAPILGYPWAMMVATLLTSVAALWFFYLLLKQTKFKNAALWLTLVFAVFPARWLIVRSIGSPEPLFMASILACFYFFAKDKLWLAAVAGAIAMLTKSPGILLFAALFLAIIGPKIQELFINPVKTLAKILPQLLPFILIKLG